MHAAAEGALIHILPPFLYFLEADCLVFGAQLVHLHPTALTSHLAACQSLQTQQAQMKGDSSPLCHCCVHGLTEGWLMLGGGIKVGIHAVGGAYWCLMLEPGARVHPGGSR